MFVDWKSTMASHLVAFYATTKGVCGPLLGTDEEDIVLLQLLVWDYHSRKTLFENQYIIRPNEGDGSQYVLSEDCKNEFGLSEEYVKAGEYLPNAIRSIELIFQKLLNDGSIPHFITDGQLHLRQVMHPKATSASIELPPFFNKFFDIRKEFRKLYQPQIETNNLTDMLKYLEINGDDSPNLAVRSIRDISILASRMTSDGHTFRDPEEIHTKLEPGICTRGEEVDNACVVRARGLPWQSSDQDIAKFFRGLNIAKGGVALCLSSQGRRNGEALVRFESSEHRDMALKRHKHHIANRYIEVYKATGEDFINVAGGNSNEAQQFLSRGGSIIIRMRGLPYDCTAKQVVDFFEAGENGCSILDNDEGVLFVKKPDGRATGDAFVLFESEEDCKMALSKHRDIIGSRYIELFRSTTAEVQQVLNRTMETRNFEQQQQPPLISQIPAAVPMLPPHMITTSSRKDCIRLRGLPYEAQVEHVLDFLGDFSKNIRFQGVHMVINHQGQPSGEAFIQMNDEQSAFQAAHNRHHRYMVSGKKQRYIEVFQCSGDDMAFVLSSAFQPQRTMVSPGMLMWDPALNQGQGVIQGASVPGAFSPAVRPPIGGTALPIFPPVIPQTPNGSQVTSITQVPIKTEPLLNHNQLAVRPPLIPSNAIDINQFSQAQCNSTFSNSKTVNSVPSSTALHSSLLNPYFDLSLAGQINPMAAGQGFQVLFPGSKYPATSLYSTFPQSAIQVPVASTSDSKSSISCKVSTPALVHMQYPPPTGHTTVAGQTSNNKRPYDQAFSSDKNVANQVKRTQPRLPAVPQFTQGQVVPLVGANPLAPASLQAQHMGATFHPQQLSALTVNPSFMFYPPPPGHQFYPSIQ